MIYKRSVSKCSLCRNALTQIALIGKHYSGIKSNLRNASIDLKINMKSWAASCGYQDILTDVRKNGVQRTPFRFVEGF